MAIALALAICLASGYLVVATAWPLHDTSSCEWWMKLFLSLGFGIGIFSVVFFFERVLGITHLAFADLCAAAALAGLYWLRRTRPKRSHSIACPVADFRLPRWLDRILTTSFAVSVLAALYATVLRARVHPHGDGWDAFAIWNLHARFLLVGGAHWRDGFSALIPWSHPDYPLLLPAAIAHFWDYLGHDNPAVPAITGLVFTFSTLGLLVSSVALLRGRTSAMLAGIALASTPFFIEQGTAQYADVPLSFFLLASIAAMHLAQQPSLQSPSSRPPGLLVLAGLATGFAAWTKNEGLLFLFAVVLAQIVSARRRQPGSAGELPNQGRAQLAPFLFALAPPLLLIAWFKHFVAPAGDLFSDPAEMAHKILTPARYWVILQWYAKEFFRFGHWWVIPATLLLIAFHFLTSTRGIRQRDPALRSSVTTLALTLAGFFTIYVITPYDLYWHLRFSLSRLFLQLWPTIIFLFFLFVAGQSSPLSQNEPNSGQNHRNC